MSIHLGHRLGIQFIKEALLAMDQSSHTHTNAPMSEGSDKGRRNISTAFDDVPERDLMIPEESYKQGAEAAFDQSTSVLEGEKTDTQPGRDRRGLDRNKNTVTTTQAWRSHDNTRPNAGRDGVVLINKTPVIKDLL